MDMPPAEPRVPLQRIVVPPSRADVHPLKTMLERAGAVVLEAPRLRPARIPATEWKVVVRAAATANLLVVSGGLSAESLLEAAAASDAMARLSVLRVVTIGSGATLALRRAGVRVDVAPKRHTAQDVARELGEVSGQVVLLIRAERAERDLVDVLGARGAEVIEASGYRMDVDPWVPEMDRLTAERWHAVAFANPTAVRLFKRALDARGMEAGQVTSSMLVAVAGPATAAAAERYGMPPTIIAGGTLRSLVESLG